LFICAFNLRITAFARRGNIYYIIDNLIANAIVVNANDDESIEHVEL